MDNIKNIPFKVYLLSEGSGEDEIRRFSVQFPSSERYDFLVKKLRDVFPGLSDKAFSLFWEDEEGDEVAVSSDEELYFAMASKLNDPVKKFFVKVKSSEMGPKENKNETVHLGVYCDGCEQNISGIRYKCWVCIDYDLCTSCRDSGVHDEHPMLRIPRPSSFVSPVGIEIPLGKHKSRRHSDGGKKKRRFDLRESGPESGDEPEEVHRGKYFHKKCKKAYKCRGKRGEKKWGKSNRGEDTDRFCYAGPYSQMVNEFLGYFNPIPCQSSRGDSQNKTRDVNQKGAEVPSHISYLKNLGTSLQKILDPLGVSVEFEVRQKEEKKNETEKKEKQPSEPSSSAPNQKEVRFAVNEQTEEAMIQKIEEITKILSNQTMNSGNDNDNGWVSFEELKKDSEEPQPSSSAEVVKISQTKSSAHEEEKEKTREGVNLYPDLSPKIPSNPTVRAALESMLAMGFTNEGNWLTSLLEAKNGDINQALEALSFQKKVNK